MADRFMHTVLTPSVLAAEQQYYGKTHPEFVEQPEPDAFSPGETEFIAVLHAVRAFRSLAIPSYHG